MADNFYNFYAAVAIIFLVAQTAQCGEICYNDVGCFGDAWPFTSVYRPIPYLPWAPEDIGTEFWLYTRRNRWLAQELSYAMDSESVAQSNFRSLHPTVFIVHGFISDGSTDWATDLKNALLDNDNVNVVIVNWEKGANPSFDYGQAVANTRVVGAQISLLIKSFIDKTNSFASRMHIIGHSLGAHIAGYAGERTSRLARITGLDPAGPFFEGTPPNVRLDPTDATYVDAIHTDADPILNLGFGCKQPVGHTDFYPNGGVDQPGCSTKWWKVSCSHGRACQLMVDSVVNRATPMIGHRCASYEDYLNEDSTCSECQQGCTQLGYYSTPGEDEQSSYYLQTSDQAPYSVDTS